MKTRNNIAFFAVAGAVLLAFGQTNSRADVLTFQQGDGGAFSETACTWIEERSDADNNYGSDVIIKLEEEYRTAVPSNNLLFQGLLGFFDALGNAPGQIPPGATINSATLTLNFSDAGGGGTPITLHQMLKPWVENEATWTLLQAGSPFGNGPFTPTQGPALNPGGGEEGVDYSATIIDAQTAPVGTRDFDLTSVMQAWVDGDPNYGLYLRYHGDNGAQFHSDDAATEANRPLLTVDFTVADPDVVLTASSPAGATVLEPGETFDVELTWSGPGSAVAVDYAVILNTNRVVLTGRTVEGGLLPYVDTPYFSSFPVVTDHVDITWFKESGFTGKDVTLHFRIPTNYTGPSVITIDLAIDGVQDGSASELESTAFGTTVNASQIDPGSPYFVWAAAMNLTGANNAPEFDADHDGRDNRGEFAFHGDPLSGANSGLFHIGLKDTTADGDSDEELTFTCAVRRDAVFSVDGNNAQVSAAIDGIIYTIEGSSSLAGTWADPVSDAGASDTPPDGSGLPDLTGTDWQYRTFSGFNGLPDRGFIHAVVTVP